ncbi:hypothetical protein ACYOEI_20600 [Singulisphaera rosea]
MIELACPKCGRGGSIPNQKINSRLVCKKCFVVFHMNTSGRTILGEPNTEVPKSETQTSTLSSRLPSADDFANLKDSLTSFTPKQAGIAAGVVAVLGIGWMIFSQPPESLSDCTTATAIRFAADDLGYLKEIATKDTVDDIVRWFDAVHPKLVKIRSQWKNKETEVRVMVIDENRKQRSGEAEAFVYPVGSAGSGTALASNAGASLGPVEPLELKLHWKLDKGRWRLDGLRTFQLAGGSPPSLAGASAGEP